MGSSKRRDLLIAFIALGLVSLFADMTYEGCRSVIGAYLEILSAPVIAAGVVGLGEFVGYLMRGVGGYLASKFRSSRGYWGLVFTGYLINLFAVPALALTGNWLLALTLVFIERVGKGLRTPARDVILAEVTKPLGRGKGFGIHEFMDQLGAISGPALVAASMSLGYGIKYSFALLAIPATAAITSLLIAWSKYPNVEAVSKAKEGGAGLSRLFWLYIVAASALSLGFIHWSLVTYHVGLKSIISTSLIPYMYLIAMLADAIVALPAGWFYDRLGMRSLVIAPALAALSTYALITAGNYYSLLLASAIWGIVMGLCETNLRVGIADLTEPQNRAQAYGIFGIIFGISWGLGNVIMSLLYRLNLSYIWVFSLFAEVTSLIILLKVAITYHR